MEDDNVMHLRTSNDVARYIGNSYLRPVASTRATPDITAAVVLTAEVAEQRMNIEAWGSLAMSSAWSGFFSID